MILANEYPNLSIYGIPYHVSGDVVDWRDLAHRSRGTERPSGRGGHGR